MLQAYTYNTSGTIVAKDAPITFENVSVETGCTATYTPGSTTINLNKPGYYMVQFNGYGVQKNSAVPKTIEVTMYKNDTEVPYASASNTSMAVDDTKNLSFSTIVKVLPSCPSIDNDVSLTFVNTGSAVKYYNTNVVVTKLC